MSVSPSSRSSGGRAKRAAATPTAAQAGSGAAEEAGMRVLSQFPNRRKKDTANSSYITLAQVKELVMQAEPFVVRDAKTGEDLTRSILLQIILEEEAGGSPIFTEAVLRNIIRFYGHAMQGFFGANLENSIQAFADMQQKMMDNAPGMDGWQKAMQEMMRTYTAQSGQVVQQMQEQMQQQLQASMQNWLEASQPKR